MFFLKLLNLKSLARFWQNVKPGYTVFTREFDKVVLAKDLDSVLGKPSDEEAAAHERAWNVFQTGLQEWRTTYQMTALKMSEEIRARTSDEERKSTSITILIDQSGSMRGQSMILAAAAVDLAQDFLRHLGCRVEVLGFTTATWKGGKSRQRWIQVGRPLSPGRLCDLLHIIYRDAADLRASGISWGFKSMLRPDLLKENVDGEALEWASERLVKQQSARKQLIVVSDGAPVDDSTLLENGPHILDRHLRKVIGVLEARDDISLAAIGISHDVSRYYSRSRFVATANDLGETLLTFLRDTLLEGVIPLTALKGD